MAGEFSTEGGGVHPGKPIIWPTGKASSTPVNTTQQSQTAGNVRNVPTQTAPTQTSSVSGAQTTTPAPAAAAKASVARALTVEDIRSHLLSNQIDPSDFNIKLASLMLRDGVELSRTNFVKILTMLQGTNKSQAMQEAAVLLLMKGIDSPQAVKVLGQYLADNPGLAGQLSAVQQGLGNLISALGMGKAMLDTNLVAQMTAIVAQFDETLKTQAKNTAINSAAGRQTMINDVRTLKALLQGLQQKAPNADSAEAQALSSALMESQAKLENVMQNLLAQAILSQKGRQEVNYHYQQIPNAMTNPPKDFEIVIKRQGEGKDAVIDPHNTQIVMSMETEKFGKMVVSMIVKENKVYVIFVFSEKNYGDQGRGLIAKEFGDFQQTLEKNNFLITGYQVKVDPAMCSIRPYLIPMLPHLEDLLKKIDIEA